MRRLLALCCGILLHAAASPQETSLATIPTTGALPVDRASAPLHVALYTYNPSALASLMNVDRAWVKEDRIDYRLETYRPLQVAAQRSWLESTFIVDFAEKDAQTLSEQLLGVTGAKPTHDQLIDFVHKNVEGDLARGWDAASIVARNRRGDCTEYAVLLAAMSRATGRPARVVIGAVLVALPTGPMTFGHAWTELQVDGQWVVGDAALRGADVIGYLPINVLRNEGVSFTLELTRLMQPWIQRVEVLSAAPVGQ
jgi:hypothetical protein